MLRYIKKIVENQRKVFSPDRRLEYIVQFNKQTIQCGDSAFNAGQLRIALENVNIASKIIEYEVVGQYKGDRLVGEYIWSRRIVQGDDSND